MNALTEPRMGWIDADYERIIRLSAYLLLHLTHRGFRKPSP